MKKLIFAIMLGCAVSAKAETLNIVIPDGWRAVIEDRIVSLDNWIHNAIKNQNEKGMERVFLKEVNLSAKLNEPLPAGRDAIIQKHFDRPDYKDRAERDLEEALKSIERER